MRLKRILALLEAILLSGLFILAIVLTAMGVPKNHLMAVIFSLIFIPIMLYAVRLMTRVPKLSDPSEGMGGDAKQTLSDTTDTDLRDELRWEEAGPLWGSTASA